MISVLLLVGALLEFAGLLWILPVVQISVEEHCGRGPPMENSVCVVSPDCIAQDKGFWSATVARRSAQMSGPTAR